MTAWGGFPALTRTNGKKRTDYGDGAEPSAHTPTCHCEPVAVMYCRMQKKRQQKRIGRVLNKHRRGNLKSQNCSLVAYSLSADGIAVLPLPLQCAELRLPHPAHIGGEAAGAGLAMTAWGGFPALRGRTEHCVER